MFHFSGKQEQEELKKKREKDKLKGPIITAPAPPPQQSRGPPKPQGPPLLGNVICPFVYNRRWWF